METQQAEPYAGVAVPVEPVPYTGAEPVAPAQVVAQESLPLPTRQAFAGARSGSILHVQLADGRILEVAVPPGTPPGHQIHFPVPAAGPIQQQPAQFAAPPPLAPAPQQPVSLVPPPPPAGAQPGVGVASVSAPETVTVQVPPGAIPGSVFRIKLTDGRDLDVTVPHGFPPGAPLTIPVPPRPVDRHGRPLAGIKKKSTATCFGPCCGPSLGCPGECECCPRGPCCCDACCKVCFFIFCCPFAIFAACAGAG